MVKDTKTSKGMTSFPATTHKRTFWGLTAIGGVLQQSQK